jgi:glycosyltransferase involved in cell wall biosynthesis
MPLRVLFAIGSMEVGGAERQLARTLKHLDGQRIQPGLYLVSKRGPLLDRVPSDVPVFAFEERVAAQAFYVPGAIHRRQVCDLAAALDEFEADLLVTRSFHMTLIGGPAARRRPTPLIAIDASDPRWDFNRNAGRFAGIKRRVIARAYREAASVIALSGGAADGIAEFYRLPRNRITVLSNSIDVGEVAEQARWPGPSLERDKFHAVSVGRLVPEKGHRDLLEAAALLIRDGRVPNLRVHLLGDGPLRSELKSLADAQGIAEVIDFVGFHENPVAYLTRCDVFCLPSLNEGMPGALLEAMACGIPVVASDCQSGPRELLRDGQFGQLVPVRDPLQLATALCNVARSPETARAAALEARRYVETACSAPAVTRRFEALFESAVRRKNA